MASAKRSPYLSQMAYSLGVPSSSLSSAHGAPPNKSDIFDLRRPDRNTIDWSIHSDGQTNNHNSLNSSYQKKRLDLSTRSEQYFHLNQRRPSARLNGNLSPPKRRAQLSRTSCTTSPLRHHLPESSQMTFDRPKMRQRTSAPAFNLNQSDMREIHMAASQVKDTLFLPPPQQQQQRNSLNNESYPRRPSENLAKNSFRGSDNSRPPYGRNREQQLQHSYVSNTSSKYIDVHASNNVRRSSSYDNLTEMAIKRPSSTNEDTLGPPSMSRQIDAMKMLKHQSGYLEKPCNTTSTYQSSGNANRQSEVNLITSNRRLSDGRTSQGGFSDDKGVMLNNERHTICGSYKRIILIGLFLLIAGIGYGGYFFFFWNFNGTESEEVLSDIGNASSSNVTDVDKATIAIKPPPADIEGRCSASNLPGSLSACLTACLPSACCYRGYSGETCLNNTGCVSYKPYCDVFFSAWDKGTEGALRDVDGEVCTEVTSAGNSTAKELPNTSPVKKRLREHTSPKKETHDYGKSRFLSHSFTQQSCQDFCISAKCCDADIISDPSLSGLVLSPFGVYTDVNSGAYVMTNCQVSHHDNIERCAKYRELCSTYRNSSTVPIPEVSTESNASMTNTSNVTLLNSTIPLLNESNAELTKNQTILGAADDTNMLIEEGSKETISPSQSISPTSTLQPSSRTQSPSISPIISTSILNKPTIIVPSANAQSVQESCATEKAKFLIRTGDASARAECIQSCLEGLCCFVNDLGYTLMDSCYSGNEHKCSQYSDCLILGGSSVQDAQEFGANSTVVEETNITISVNETYSYNHTYSYNDTLNSTNIQNETSGASN